MPAVGLGLNRSRVNGGSRSLSLSLPLAESVSTIYYIRLAFIRLFEKLFDRLEMVRNRARVPSPRHDKKKAYEQLRGRLFSGENEPGAKPEPTAYEQLRENRSLGRVCF